MIGTPTEYVIGRPYHLEWAKNRGMCWILKGFNINTGKAILETPRTRKKLLTNLKDLRDVNNTINTYGTSQAG